LRKVPRWYDYFMDLARAASARSKDPRTNVGAILIGPDRRILSLGYNGFPDGILETEERWTSAEKDKYVIHAEVNALANAARSGVSTDRSWAVITLAPCPNCARTLIAAGIKAVVVDAATTKARLEARPELVDDYTLMRQLFDEAGVAYHEV